MASTMRTFVAVPLTPPVRSRALDLVNRLSESGAGVKWVAADNIHLTLKFLGDVPDTEIPAVCREAAEGASEVEPFSLECVGAGAFPSLSRPSTLWIGVGQGEEQIVRLYRAIDLRLRKLGFPKEGRKFHPHITIGRLRHGRSPELTELLKKETTFAAGTLEVQEAVVYCSTLGPGGPVYDALARAPLGG